MLRRLDRFYVEGLGMRWVEFGDGRQALHFGGQKINLHHQGRELEPKALHPVPGSADLCFLSAVPIEATVRHIAGLGYSVLLVAIAVVVEHRRRYPVGSRSLAAGWPRPIFLVPPPAFDEGIATVDERTLTALYDSHDAAEAARDELVA